MVIMIDLRHQGITIEDRGRWEGADVLLATGDTLQDLLGDARVFFSDQDGEETRDLGLDDFTGDRRDALVSLLETTFRERTR